ncbi:hypothetical protein [Lysobacter gummosus]|uniref:hypothetical protein n=1 Tax=Lysobacter gummosus TaxID=262324 RepID=UPI00363BFFBF
MCTWRSCSIGWAGTAVCCRRCIGCLAAESSQTSAALLLLPPLKKGADGREADAGICFAFALAVREQKQIP